METSSFPTSFYGVGHPRGYFDFLNVVEVSDWHARVFAMW